MSKIAQSYINYIIEPCHLPKLVCLNGALTPLSSSLSSSYWQRPYTKQTRTYHVGPDIFFASGCGSIHPSAISGKTPGSEVQLEIF